ncbi:MAG: alpha-amylase [Paludibacteraceae bacterium]|nr:alpha-amylase [Paludibacteraceae bacterium]
MKNICFCFQMHAPYRMKRYRFFDIGADHYYYEDMQSEDQVQYLASTSYLPLCQTLQEMIRLSRGKFRCAFAISGEMLEMFEQFVPEMIDSLKALAATKCVEFVTMPYAYSLASQYDTNEFIAQVKLHADKINELFGLKSTALANTELLFDDEFALLAQKLGFKTCMTEGSKHLLSWKSPNYVYQAAAAPKVKLLLRNASISDSLSFLFSDPSWSGYPMDAEKFTQQIVDLPKEEDVVNIWLGAETFGIRQQAATGIFEFLKAIPYYALEKEIGFLTPSEAGKKPAVDSLAVPFPNTWCGEAKDLSPFAGNDLQQEALSKLYAVAERVHLCQDKSLKRDWLHLQVADNFLYMNHINAGNTNYESAYDAFINYMNILSDFLQRVEEQYPTTIENEELNGLLKTINNQNQEIEKLQEEIHKLRARKKA